MDASIINPFLSACEEAFATMFNIIPQHKEPYLLDPLAGHKWEISGLVAVSGDEMGVIAFRLHRILAAKMLEISGVPVDSPEERDEMMNQLVSEFTNIITGNAVSSISSENILVSAPVIRTGENHVIPWPRSTHVIAVPFTTRQGSFEVNICFRGM
ncbi:MAG TPA: chemotaxis protein CheX [Treponema sp.]|nr:chemotaxis protein CheX [Treponema sp.]